MRVDLISIFPRMLDSIIEHSIIRRAIDNQLLNFHAHDLRKWSNNKHFTVDDRPFGGGAGMLLQPIPLANAIKEITNLTLQNNLKDSEICYEEHHVPNSEIANNAQTAEFNTSDNYTNNHAVVYNNTSNSHQFAEHFSTECANEDCNECNSKKIYSQCVIYLCPDGELLNTKIAQDLAKFDQLILVSGHYEGIDQRVRDKYIDREISIGDYILTNGTIAAGVLLDAVCRYIPGVLGNSVSLEQDSFYDGLLTFPQYSRPEIFENMRVPEILLSGNHKEIEKWRMQQRIERTKHLRPDLYQKWIDETMNSSCQ